MNNTESLVLAALKDKAPSLHRSLAQSGELKAFVADRANQISSEVVSLTQQDRIRNKWDDLGPMECARKLKMAEKLNEEVVLADLLEFPQDETSPSSPAATTPSDQMT